MKGITVITLLSLYLAACSKSDDPTPAALYEGKLERSEAVRFSGACTWSVEYINSDFQISFKETGTISDARVSTDMIETVISGGCSSPYPRNTHHYTLRSYSLEATRILLYFKQDSLSFPQNEASFAGTIGGSDIEGTLTFYRTSNAIFCKVDMPFTLIKDK